MVEKGKPHTVYYTFSFRLLFSVVRGNNPLRQAPLSRVNQFVSRVWLAGKAIWLEVGGRVRTVGHESRIVRVCIYRILATRGSSRRPGARTAYPCENWRPPWLKPNSRRNLSPLFINSERTWYSKLQ